MLAYARNAFLTALAHRVDLWGTMLSTLVMLLVQYALWRAIYAAGSGEIGGFTLSEMLTYVLLGRVVATFTSPEVTFWLQIRVRRGTIALDLARPIDMQLVLFAQGLGTNLFRLVAVGIPAFGLLWGLGLTPLPGPDRLLLFALSLVLGYLILFGLNFLLGLVILQTGSGNGLDDLEEMVIRLFSGRFLPVTLFPDWLRAVSRALPFEGIYYLPLAIYTGAIAPSEMALALGRQALWCAALLLAGRLLWARAVQRMVVQGG
ncbi:MAG: ABC transporter permease [Bacillota bacterium]